MNNNGQCFSRHDWRLLETSTYDRWESLCLRCGARKTEWEEWLDDGGCDVVAVIESAKGKKSEYRYTKGGQRWRK